jgi:pyrroline-5-carboxylate reductase
MTIKIAVIGCGNMSWPIITRMHQAFSGEIEFHTYTPSKERSRLLSTEVNGVHHDELQSFEAMDFWFIACKPQQLESLASDIGSKIKDQKVISILAATSIAKLEKEFHTKFITRVMPNTPSALGMGIELITHSESLDISDQLFINKMFEACGEVLLLETEKEFDELTVFSGSGPAYIYRFALSYEKKLIEMGYSEHVSRKLLNQLFTGSSALMQNSEDKLQVLVDKVTSKGGVTIEAIKVLEGNTLDNTVSKSVDSALKRGKEIAQELDS